MKEPSDLFVMKIGIDVHAAERDGTGNCTYIRNLVKNLVRIDTQNNYVFYVTDIKHSFYQNFTEVDNLKIKQLPVKNPLVRIPFLLARQTYADALDILHVQYNAPPFHGGKLVTTIHDIGFLFHPKSFSKLQGLRLKVLTRMTAGKSHKILTVSNYSKNDIVRTYNLDPEKVEVVPNGISSLFKPNLSQVTIQTVLGKYNIRGNYILSVGRLNPRKNLNSLVQAYSDLKRTKQIPHSLVIVGQDDYETRQIMKAVKENDCGQHIILTGFVPDEELPYLYGGADVFVYPSVFEGFGLPVLEAMKCGTPVVTSNTTSLKEVVGDAGRMVDPLDVKDITQAIFQVISNSALKTALIEKGLARAHLFSWEKTAQKTLKIYERVFASDL